MAKQGGPGNRDKGRPARGRGKSPSRAKIGRSERRDRSESKGGPRRTKAASIPPVKGRRDRDGIVRKAHPPDAHCQRLEVEDRDGGLWAIECLGDAVEEGARIAFEPLLPVSNRRGQMIRMLSAERERWVCRVGSSITGGILPLTLFGGVEGPNFQLRDRDAKGAKEGDRVVVVLLAGASKTRGGNSRQNRKPAHDSGRRGGARSVRVARILGQAGEPDADHAALVWKHRLPESFSRRARLEADSMDETLTAEVLRDRVDLRHLPFITIDPSSAKDHDDAVFAEERSPDSVRSVGGKQRPARWKRRLWVAIADVSHFVDEGGFIDSEARRRGNSFYFPDRSIPMLPERLSSDLCSLRPEVDRLAMVVELRLAQDGKIVDGLFHEAVIRSQARLAYEDAAEWLGQDGDEGREEPVWGASLRCLDRMAADFGRARQDAGALTLELPEVEIVIGPDGRPTDAQLRSRNRAHILIEEAMLAANRTVARALDIAERTTIHRVHPPPPPSKLDALALMLKRLGIDVEGDLSESGVLASALASVRGQPSEERVHMAALRSMSQARYEAVSGGHHALRFDHYLHFTSPIRRYADLEVHRGLRRLIRDEALQGEEKTRHAERCDRVARWLSGRERVATEVERDAEALASCALMSDRVGERFAAEITGATEYGLFIRLESPSVSGLIPMRTLEGRWEVDEEGDALVADRSGAKLAVGGVIQVRLLSVDQDRGRLAFRMESKKTEATRSRGVVD